MESGAKHSALPDMKLGITGLAHWKDALPDVLSGTNTNAIKKHGTAEVRSWPSPGQMNLKI